MYITFIDNCLDLCDFSRKYQVDYKRVSIYMHVCMYVYVHMKKMDLGMQC